MQMSSNQYFVFPKWVSEKSLVYYFALQAVVAFVFYNYSMQWFWFSIGFVEIFCFFHFGANYSRAWNGILKQEVFEKKIFWTAFWVRFVYMLIMYWTFSEIYGNPFGFDAADATFYDSVAKGLSSYYRKGNFNILTIIEEIAPGTDLSDRGYATYLSFVYYLTDDSIFIARIIKCVWSAFTVVLIYRLSNRNFGEQVARLAAVFCMMMPNFWYYCGVHIKEVEMVFLSVLFVERTDAMLRIKNFSVGKVSFILLIVLILFTFRTPLALVCLLSLFFSVIMSSSKIIDTGKRIAIGFFVLSLVAITMGNRIQEEASYLIERVSSGEQKTNMEWRMRRGIGHGNEFAKYAGAAVFAPLIFTIPFPTLVETPGQEIQRIHHVGNYVKNVLSGFVIFAIFFLFFKKKWREHLMPISFMLAYLAVLTMSSFAQSERFHQPVQPIEMMFAAYGISLCGRKERKWFNYWMIFLFVVTFAWQWFKLKGKGIV